MEKKKAEDAKRQEEMAKQKAEEDAKRKDEEGRILRQQQATLAVLRVLQNLSNANPENFDSLNKELEEVLKTELPETGSQQDILRQEADRVLEYAKQYVDQVREQQKKLEEQQRNTLQLRESQEK